jgi:hypothetical protein
MPKVTVGLLRDAQGRPARYTLTLGQETITLEPGRAWIQADAHKWVTRGLLEEPQSYHVAPEGHVEINGEKISLTDPGGTARLEHEINKRHTASSPATTAAQAGLRKPPGPPRDPTQATFHVRLDLLSHLAIACFHGEDHLETGLRGLTTLITNGLMRKPGTLHIDPLQRWIEIDGHRFECKEEDARRFEALLNSEYRLQLRAAGEGIIEIKDNPASATGFDIHFTSFHAGLRTEVKGHLTQANLDILQNDQRCDLLQHGILLRLSPPNLLIRRRRPDGGEERIPNIPDVAYRRINAADLQAIFNDPRLRRAGRVGEGASAEASHPAELEEIRVVRSPTNRLALWLECVAAYTGRVEGMALTHHNIADLQHRGVFRPECDVAMSVDGRELSVLNTATAEETKLRLTHDSPDDHLAAARRLLTSALKTPSAPPVAATPTPEPASDESPPPEPVPERPARPSAAAEPVPQPPPPSEAALPTSPVSPVAAPEPQGIAPASPPESEAVPVVPDDEPAEARTAELIFPEQDPRHVIEGSFSALTRDVEIPVQELWLSLPHVFAERRFVVLNFGGREVAGLGELRSASFYGFYLSFVDPHTVVLVYAREGHHIEWGPTKCVVQASLSAEAEEFKGHGLLGLAQDEEGNFLFVVTPTYRQWIRPRERDYRAVFARFLTAEEFAAEIPRPTLIWPEVAA